MRWREGGNHHVMKGDHYSEAKEKLWLPRLSPFWKLLLWAFGLEPQVFTLMIFLESPIQIEGYSGALLIYSDTRQPCPFLALFSKVWNHGKIHSQQDVGALLNTRIRDLFLFLLSIGHLAPYKQTQLGLWAGGVAELSNSATEMSESFYNAVAAVQEAANRQLIVTDYN